VTSSLLEVTGQILGASFIAPLMAVVYGLLSEPLQRRSGVPPVSWTALMPP